MPHVNCSCYVSHLLHKKRKPLLLIALAARAAVALKKSSISLEVELRSENGTRLLNQYISARARLKFKIGTVSLLTHVCSVPPGRAQREPQG